MNELITGINDAIWGYVLIGALVLCGLWFTWKTKGVQFRMIGEMFRLLGDSAVSGTNNLEDSNKSHKHISSFQAFAVSVATRVGTGNLAGVATAIAIGGPGAVFWMWLIALLGSSTAFVESPLPSCSSRGMRIPSSAVLPIISGKVFTISGWPACMPSSSP